MIPRYTLPGMGSVWSDANRLNAMLDVELRVLEAQADIGLVPRKALSAIRRRARVDVATIRKRESRTHHDVIAFIEQLEERMGPYGRYLHFGLTSSDVLDTSLAILLRKATDLLIDDLKALRKAIAAQARKHRDTLTIGRTHGVHAEPTTFGLKLAVYYDELGRHLKRLEQVKIDISVGKISGAVGTFASVDPRIEQKVCRKLSLRPAPISTQIIQRDVHAQYVSVLSLIGASLEKLATEIRHLQRTEVQELKEPFGRGQKGSSAMPHKQNPILCERVAGLSRLLRSYAVAASENISLWHERDISHSSVERVILPDASILLDYMLQTLASVMRGLVVDKARMRKNLEMTRGTIYSGCVLLALMRKGTGRTKAYEMVQRPALKAWRGGRDFSEVLMEDKEIRKYLSPEILRRCLDPRTHIRHVNRIFKRVGL